MGLNIISLALVLAITFMHSIFGFFSGLINVVCTIASVAVAFGFYEKVTDLVTAQLGLNAAYAAPAALVLLFVIAFAILRTLADNYIRGNVRVPAALDWAGAVLCGIINAQLIVGVAVIAIMMLPLRSAEKSTVLGFVRYERVPEERDPDHGELVKFERHNLWLRSDEFTVGLVNLLSGGSLRGKTTFREVYPDFVEAVYDSANTVQPESSPAPYRDKKGGDGFKKGIAVGSWWVETKPINARYAKGVPTAKKPDPGFQRIVFKPAPGKKLIGMEIVLKKASADRDKRSFAHVFRPTMLRLVGRVGDQPVQVTPRILGNVDERLKGGLRVVDPDTNCEVPGSGRNVIYAYFEVDEAFKPTFLEYRRFARAPVGPPAENAPRLVFSIGGKEERGGGGGRGSSRGRTFGNVLESGSRDNSTLPFEMVRRAVQNSGDVVLEGDKLKAGRFFASRSRLEPTQTSQPVIKEFLRPPGKRVIQVRYKPRKARTLVGQVFNFVGQLNQYYAEDVNANQYFLAGYFAIVKRNNQDYIELFFNGDPDDPWDPSYKHMLDFKEIDRHEINDQDDAILGLIFVVPDGTKIRAIKNQAGEGVDIRIEAAGG